MSLLPFQTDNMHPTPDNELDDAELTAVDAGTILFSLLSNLMQMRHEMLKGIVQNLRA